MKLYQLFADPLRPTRPCPGPCSDPLILVIADDPDAARKAAETALGMDDAAPPVPQPEEVSVVELGPHKGPEEPGSVFLNGFLIVGE